MAKPKKLETKKFQTSKKLGKKALETRKVQKPKFHKQTSKSAAGILFISGNKVLAGRRKYVKDLSGIGGKTELGEKSEYTAVREALEEVFGVKDVPEFVKTVLRDIRALLKFETKNKNYSLHSLPMRALVMIARKINSEGIESSIFKRDIPETISGIIEEFNRSRGGEFIELLEINLREYPSGETLDPYFVEDLHFMRQKLGII